MLKKIIPILLVGLLTMVTGVNCVVKADGTTNFTMMISSDPQYQEKDDYDKINNQYEDMNVLAADGALNLNVLGCIINGDLTNCGHKEQLDAYRELTGKLTMKVYPGLGNHDYDFCVGKTAQNKAADNMVLYMYDWIQDNKTNLNLYDVESKTSSSQGIISFFCKGSLAYSFDIGKVHMIQLQNYPAYSREWAGSSFGFFMMATIKNSFAWLEKDLAKARWEGKSIIVNLHDGGWDKFTMWTDADTKARFYNLLIEYGVSAVFAGHVHDDKYCGFSEYIPNSQIPYFLCGSSWGECYLMATFDTDQKKMVIQKRHAIGGGSYGFDSSQSRSFDLNDSTPTYGFETDCKAGEKSYKVAYDGKAQWMADLNGDGRADYIYLRDDSKEYRVLLSDPTKSSGKNALLVDKSAGTRTYNLGFEGEAQWLADVNGDGCPDLVYNRADTHEYWVMFGKTDGTFDTAQKWGLRDSGNNVGYDGKAQWLADVNGDGCADFVYNRDDTHEYWVILGKREIPKGMILSDMLAGTRQNDVGDDGNALWLADVNGDGRADLVYNKEGIPDYWVMLSNEDGTFAKDSNWGSRTKGVGCDGKAQWLADVNGDGRADYVYNQNGTPEYWVMLSQEDHTFATDTKWLKRANGVEYGIYGQGWADLNGDGKMDYIYNQDGFNDYQVMLSQDTIVEQYWGSREYNVAWNGKGAFLSDINGDGLPDLVYIRDDSKEIRVLLSKVTGTETN
jgi:hypothetical protein